MIVQKNKLMTILKMSYDNLAANSPTIPLHLQSLFESMNFLASAVKDGKPCFKTRTYVDRSSYWGAFVRWSAGEKQSAYGNDKIRLCCESACQAYEVYKTTNYEPILIEKMFKLRKGLCEIRDTYERENEIDTVNHINDSIMILDFKLPQEFKLQTGITIGTSPNLGPISISSEEKVEESSAPIAIPPGPPPIKIGTPEGLNVGSTGKKKGKNIN
jgi:hypothetical protein